MEHLLNDKEYREKFDNIINTRILLSKNQSKNILNHNINFNNTLSILNDIKIDNNSKYVVFFNFEFVLHLLKLGIPVNNIIYVANHRDSNKFVNLYFKSRGMKSILFDLTTYKKYEHKKQWIKYLMKKIGKLNEFIGIGNIPFTVNDTDSTNSKKVGNDFIKLMNQFKESCYILPAKFDSKTFKEDLITNPKLKKIVYHKNPIFDIHEGVKTCHVVLNSNNKNTFEYTDNTTTDKIELKKDINLILSREYKESYIIDSSKLTLGNLWTRGNKSLNKITKQGNYKVITSLGSYKSDDFNFEYDDSETTSLGQWKVIIPNLGGGKALKIAGPEYSLSYSVIGFCVDTEESAKKLYNYIKDNNILEETKKIKTSNANTKTLFEKIILPDGLI